MEKHSRKWSLSLFITLLLQITWSSLMTMTGCRGSGKTCHCIQGTSTLSFCISYLSHTTSSGSWLSTESEWAARVARLCASRAAVLVRLITVFITCVNDMMMIMRCRLVQCVQHLKMFGTTGRKKARIEILGFLLYLMMHLQPDNLRGRIQLNTNEWTGCACVWV